MNRTYKMTGQIAGLLLLLLLSTGLSATANVPKTAPPNWDINPDDFEFNMSLVVRVNFDGLPSNNANNIVGVFVGNELRGVATPISVLGDQFYYITAYSNQYFGETLKFRVYYAPNDEVYATPETVNFIHNSTVGSLGAPFWLNIDPNQDFPPELLPILADTTLQNIPFDEVNLLDYLVSVDGDPVTWSSQAGPNLTASILNGILTVTPVSNLWSGTELVRIIATENTPNQLADTIFGSFTVLPDYGAPVWQTIPNQTIFPGDEFSSFDLDDYLDFDGPCHQFDFDVFPFTGSDPDPSWAAVPPGVNPMTVIARPLFVDIQLAGAGSKLAGFVNGNLAGWAAPTGISPNVSYELILANVGAGTITFQFYDADNQYLYTDSSSLNFVAGGSVGSLASPHLIQLSPLFPTLDANGVMDIEILDTSWLGAYPIDFIVWDCDYPDTRRDTTQAVFTITNDERPQITSAATVNFQENACSVLYDTQTSDPNDSEGAGLTYTLAGGADETRFTIDAVTGILSWGMGFSPDFENPEDANMDNQYEVNIQVTNSLNLSSVLALVVTITNQNPEPFEALINGGVNAVCATGSVNLSATGGVSYVWSTGATTASISVNSAGTYSVTATSSGACVDSTSVVVAPPPSITAAGNSGTVCLGSTIQLSSSPTGGTPPYATFSWTGPDNYSSNLEDPLGFPATAASSGVYTVIVTDSIGCTASATTTITVTANSAPTITASSNSPVCVGANINLSSTPSGGSGIYTQYSWSGPNNYSSAARNPVGFSALLASAGTYSVTVTDNAGCAGTGTTVLVVNPKPSIVAASNTPVCVGVTVLLTSTPSGGTSPYTQYSWAGPNSFSASVQNPAGFPATMADGGTYTVTVTDNLGCTTTGTTNLIVTGLPAITATLLSPVCTGGTVALGSTPSGGSGQYSSFLWNGPNNYSSTMEDPTPFPVTPAVAGDYFVTVTDVSGCTASSSVTVTVNPLPSITAMNNGPVCQGSNITLSSTASGGSGVYSLFLWTGPDFYVASVEDPVPFSTTLASAGVYQVVVTDSKGCTASATTTVVINSKPTLTASSNSPVCTGANLDLNSNPSGGSGAYSTFSWTGPNSFSSSMEDPTDFPITIADAGTYRVTVTDNAGCTATASTSVAVSTLPAPTATASSNSPVCGGTNLVLNSSASGGSGIYAAYAWSGPNSYASGMKDPTPFIIFTNGAGVYTVTVTDSKNCKGTASVSVTVDGPNSAPTSNSPVCPNGTILLDGGPFISGATYSWSGPNNYTASTRLPAGFPAIPAAAGTYSLTITENGCSGLGTTTVEIGDITPPVIVCPANTTVSADANCSGTVGSHAPASVSDNCAANPAVTQSPVASTPLNGHNDAKTITLTANDGNGNTASCTFTVTLLDVTPPSITCPANVTIAADANCAGVLGTYSPVSVSDNCAANPAVTQSPAASTVLSGHNDAETVTLTANDGNGNTANCMFTVTLLDVTPPSIVCPANVTIAADANCEGLVGTYTPVSVSDNCAANPSVTQSPIASTVLSGHDDVETVTLTADDGNGNTASCSLTVTLKDITPPSIVCPANVTIAADANCAGVVGTYSPVSVSDNCTVNPVVTQSPAGSTVLSGHNDVETVTLTANDGNGNTASCMFTVTLLDITPPSIVCPADVTIAADANCAGVVGTYTPVSVSDNCTANPVVTQSPAGSTVLSGHNDAETVTLTADDGNGNTANCMFTVTLLDVTPPSIVCPANVTIAADANCEGLVGTYTPVSVSDNCTANPSVTQSPAASTVLSGHNDFETVTLTADDGNGNTASCSLTVTLKDVTKPSITCPANTTLSADANCSSPLGAYAPVSVSDNCTANPVVTQSPAASTVLSGHNDFEIVTLTADDGNGNTEFCTFTVTLKDITPPTVVCKPFTAALDDMGNISITTADVYDSGADNCGTVNQVSVVPNSFNCSNLGPNTVVLTVNDGNGNTATCNAVVTVVDLIPPTMLCKNAVVFLNTAGQASITVADINNGSTDNCTITGLSLAPTTFNCSNIGLVNIVTLTATDQSGNTATCTATVTVVDTIKPTMLCQNATLNLNAAGQATLTVANINNGSFDNCTIATFSLSKTAFTCADLGANTVTLTGTDQSGNSASCTATVTVQDLIPPTALCKNIIANLGVNGTITVLPSAINNGSSDNCSFTLSLNSPTFTCANIGLVNTVTLTATDLSGNTATCTARVTVRDVSPPTSLCKPVTIFLNGAGQATLSINQVDNGSTDNCGIDSRTLLRTQFNCGDIASPVINVMTVTDNSGNSSTCTAAITVRDNIAPTAICQDVVVALVNGSVTVLSSQLAANSTDNCSVTSYAPVAQTYFVPGVYNLTITVRDWSNNGSNCTSQITVLPSGPSPRPEAPSAESEPSASLNLSAYPNPTNGLVVLEFELPEVQSFVLRAFNLNGKAVLIQKGMGAKGANSISVQLDSQAPGLYFLELSSEELRAGKRLILNQ